MAASTSDSSPFLDSQPPPSTAPAGTSEPEGSPAPLLAPALVVALATGLRLAWVLLVPTRPVGDFAMYRESAAHLLAHGALDPEFVYMPGYVLLLALVQAAGGGLLACKIIAVALGGLAAGAVYGTAAGLWNRRAALITGLLYALWPGGIAVCSVTGTDLPAAALLAFALWALVRVRASRAPLMFGLLMGAAAWIRAVSLPLSALSVLHFRVRRGRWGPALRDAALACAVTLAVLVPWAARNRLRYGETFFTDSHGGLTALVGANPDTDGRYSRSLNRIFWEVTGHHVLAEPHRLADREAYAMAGALTRFEPAYALGLVGLKADRLLANERALLYWPLYRVSVLGEAQARWFAERQRGLEALVDGFWYFLVGASVFGLVVAAAGRRRAGEAGARWAVLSLVPFPLALVALYAVFFAEARYHLSIAILLFPAAGAAVAWLAEGVAGWRSRARLSLVASAAVVALFGGWWLLLHAGERLRDRHRFAMHVCRVGDQARLCLWGRPPGAAGDSPLLGVWDGVGLSLIPGAEGDLALPLPAGRYRVRAEVDLAPTGGAVGGEARLQAGPQAAAVALDALERVSREGRRAPISLEVAHPGGTLVLRLTAVGAAAPATRLWLSDLHVDRLD